MQALKEEQEVMREKSKAVEDEVVRLTESHAAARTSWDKEVTQKPVLRADGKGM